MYRFCRNSPIFSVFICKIPIYAREIFKVLRDLLIYSDLYPPVRERGFRRSGAAAPRPTHRSVPSAFALHAAARTARGHRKTRRVLSSARFACTYLISKKQRHIILTPIKYTGNFYIFVAHNTIEHNLLCYY